MIRMFAKIALMSWLSAHLFAAKITLDFYQKQVYHIGSVVRLRVALHNDNQEVYFLRLADKKMFNVKLMVSKVNEEPLLLSPSYLRQLQDNKLQFYRDLSLGKNEEYAFIVELADYVEITEPGVYLIQAQYQLAHSQPLSSNKLFLYIRPESEQLGKTGQHTAATQAILRKEKLAPDEVISYTLQALQQQQWQLFALYLDLEMMIEQAPQFRYRYRNASPEKQLLLKNEFLDSLQQGQIIEEKALIRPPNSFEIIQTHYSKNQAQVEVLENFKEHGYEDQVRYLYYLNYNKGYWSLHGYRTLSIKNRS